jgi:aspartate/methionine/tyrosine aminotransferase
MELKAKATFTGIDISEIRKMNALAGPKTINLGIGQLPNDLPEALSAQGKEAFSKGKTRYTSNQGLEELRELVASYHSEKCAKPISGDQVVITNGAEGAVWNILYTYLEAGDEVLIPEIAFTIYDTISKMQGAVPRFYKGISSLKELLSDKTKFVILNSPNNPTGLIIPEEDIRELAALAEERGFYIISDEIYGELYLDDKAPITPLKYTDRVIVVDGISKRAAATGLRIGWTVSPLELTKPMVISNQYIATCASSVSQYAAIKSLDGSSDAFVRDIRRDLAIKRDFAYEKLSSFPGITVEKSQGAFYIFPDISAYGSSKEVARRILEECDVLTIPGVAFGRGGDRNIRISFAVEMDDLKESLNRLEKLFNSWSPNER